MGGINRVDGFLLKINKQSEWKILFCLHSLTIKQNISKRAVTLSMLGGVAGKLFLSK